MLCLLSYSPNTLLLSPSRSRPPGLGGQVVKLDHAAHVVGHFLQPDARLGASNPDAAHQRADRVVCLRAEQVLDPRADLRPALVALLLTLAERAVAMTLAVDAALQAAVFQLAFDLGRPVRAVRPDV